MKKLIAAACIAAALVVPASAAQAADERPGAGVEICDNSGYIGVWAWYYDVENDYHRIWTCIYIGP